MLETSTRYDAVIVGGRCAGAATAIRLASAGLRVLVVERAAHATDTLSTHALMRPAIVQLKRLGVLDALHASGAAPIRSTTFYYGERQLELAVKPGHGTDALYAPRRFVLDALLIDAARAAGAEVRHGTALLDLLLDEQGRVRGAVVGGAEGTQTVASDLVIGADGRKSSVAQRVGAPIVRRARHASAFVYGYYALPLEGYHWFYRPGSAAGSVATHDGQCCVFAALPARADGRLPEPLARDFEAALAATSALLGEHVMRARRQGPLRTFAGRPGYLRKAAGQGWALVGDASFFKEPLTSHGITAALRDAEFLARAVIAGGEEALAHYEAQRDALSIEQLEIGDAFASFSWSLDDAQALHLRLAETVRAELKALCGAAGAVSRAA